MANKTNKRSSAASGKKKDERSHSGAIDEAIEMGEKKSLKADDLCKKIKQDATSQLHKAREKTLGELVDAVVAAIKKYPVAGVFGAMVVGFFLGRLLRR